MNCTSRTGCLRLKIIANLHLKSGMKNTIMIKVILLGVIKVLKKFAAVLICVIIVSGLCGCNSSGGEYSVNESDYVDITSNSSEKEVKVVTYTNPLTGVKNLTADNIDARPVAVMVNNITVAQQVQTGLNYADIVYETEVEGGVTRLMAVFKDFSAAKQIGSVRSARYPYVDLALAHDAIYVHCGQDPNYCAPHLKDIDDISVDSAVSGAKRIKNGLASEHTLYVFGNELWETLASKFRSEVTKNALWQNFADEGESVSLSGGRADRVEIPFPILKTVFEYDEKTGLYTRFSRGSALKDYVTGDKVTVKNVFILMTSISTYPDGVHRRVDLTGGRGYYITNGTYMPIKWQKGGEKSPIKITDENGGEIKVSTGNSWVCIPNTATCKPVIESAVETETNSDSASSDNS